MSEQDNLKIAREGFDTWNAHDPNRYGKLLDENHVWESDTVPAPVMGREAVLQLMQMYFRAFPDLHFEIDQMLASGEYVVTRYTATGTHRGELMGIPATNKLAKTRGCTVSKIQNGKLVHGWVYWDTGALMRQLGVLPNQPSR